MGNLLLRFDLSITSFEWKGISLNTGCPVSRMCTDILIDREVQGWAQSDRYCR